jgi:glutamate racemase
MIGVFDSGIGGLGVLREMMPLFAGVHIRFVADRANAPYGTRSLSEVQQLTHDHASRLIEDGSDLVVIACNTASAAALDSLRIDFPSIPFVGMEPAVKPAAAATRTGVIGVLATGATFQGRLFSSLIDEYGSNLRVLTRAAPEWVELVESGRTSGSEVDRAVEMHLEPLIEEGADTLVLGCTHFPFLTDPIRKAAGEGITIIDPAGAVARQAKAMSGNEISPDRLDARVSGDVGQFKTLASSLAGISFTHGVLPLGQ